jgi:hypothetical protein
MSGQRSTSILLRARITCPHCWHQFAPEEVLWISKHSALVGDAHLGKEAQQRFLPTRFTVNGDALDARDVACYELACPNCHLSVPRALLEMEPLFISFIGAPSSGKSYFLACMTWQLRKALHNDFSLSFQDADPVANELLIDYERTLFLNPQDDQLTSLQKTQKQAGGELYLNFRRFPSVKSTAFRGCSQLGPTRPLDPTCGNYTPVSRMPIFQGFAVPIFCESSGMKG